MQNLCTESTNLCEEIKNNFDMTTSQHAKCRLQQRAINPWALEQIMKYGERLFSRQAFIDSLTANEKAMRK